MAEELSAIISDDLERRVRGLLERAGDAKISIAAAESCTGGLLASLLTDVEGASHVFERGFVVYSDGAKCDLLGLAQATIDRCGAVSAEVARAMAEGAIAGSGATIAVAITGYAGPAGEGQEHGLVHLATATRGGPTATARSIAARWGGPVRLAAIETAIDMLGKAVRGWGVGRSRGGVTD